MVDHKTKYRVEYKDQMWSLRELETELGIKYSTLYRRYKLGYDVTSGRKYPTSYKVNSEGRQCTRCKEFKAWDSFYNSKIGINKKMHICIGCNHNEM
jgi:hypothetical protein